MIVDTDGGIDDMKAITLLLSSPDVRVLAISVSPGSLSADNAPPLSCMNDGIQVSTGATPGHSLLTVRNDATLSASVEFKYLNRKIRLALKPEIAYKISSELKEIDFVYGLDSNIYWELVRKNTIKYWRDLDRHEIFVIEEI